MPLHSDIILGPIPAETSYAGWGEDWGYSWSPNYAAEPVAPDNDSGAKLFARLKSRMHRKLRESPMPNLSALLKATVFALLRLSPGTKTQHLYLIRHTSQVNPDKITGARGKLLDYWGELLVLPRLGGELDESYRLRMSREALTRDLVTRAKIIGVLNESLALPGGDAADASVQLLPGHSLTARYDQLNHYYENQIAMDFNPLDLELGLPDNKRVWARAGAYDSGGLVIYLPLEYDAERLAKVRALIDEYVAPGTYVDLLWKTPLEGYDSAPSRNIGEHRWRPLHVKQLSDGGVLLPDGNVLYGNALPLFGYDDRPAKQRFQYPTSQLPAFSLDDPWDAQIWAD